MGANATFRTTKTDRDVKSIVDIRNIESIPYDENVAARNLHDFLTATAEQQPERPALTTRLTEGFPEPASSLSHRQLLSEVNRTANRFATLNASGQGVVAILCPTLPEIPATLQGACWGFWLDRNASFSWTRLP